MLSQPPFWLILIAFIAALGPLIIIHELGHYFVGRWFGVGAEAFSIGFGPEIGGWTDRRGTRWRVAAIPLGGYVRFVGDADATSAPSAEPVRSEDRERSFHLKPVWQRFLIVLAGPAANFILAMLIFAVFFAVFGAPRTNVVGQILPNSAAAAAGLQPGDRLLSIGARSTPTFNDVRAYVALRPGRDVTVKVERGGAILQRRVTLQEDTATDEFGQTFKRGVLGVYPTREVSDPLPVTQAIPAGAEATFKLTVWMVDALGQIVTGQRSVTELGGPLKMAQIAGQRATLGAFEFVELIALFSINLGFINLLPIPMLDGGHLLFYSIEAVRRRPLSVRAQDWAFRGGLAVLLALVLFTTVNDLGSFGLWDRLGSLIG